MNSYVFRLTLLVYVRIDANDMFDAFHKCEHFCNNLGLPFIVRNVRYYDESKPITNLLKG